MEKIPKNFALIELIKETGWKCNVPYEEITDDTLLTKSKIKNSKVEITSIYVSDFKQIIENTIHVSKLFVKGWYEQ